jgi:hypothetical protein
LLPDNVGSINDPVFFFFQKKEEVLNSAAFGTPCVPKAAKKGFPRPRAGVGS